jgi:aryl-phospho-beta-D-glucosidase BglC (GH1 family)
MRMPATTINRRKFLSQTAMAGAGATLAACAPQAASPTPIEARYSVTVISTVIPERVSTPTQAQTVPASSPKLFAHLPRWRGFNLLEKFTLEGNAPYLEWDLDRMADWGFDFIRLPTDYRIWTVSDGVYAEDQLREIDQVIGWARARKIHTNLCLHRAPGYCVNPPEEALNMWEDGADGEKARQAFAAQWAMFAERYRGIPAQELSFDLVNEPGEISTVQYVRAVTGAVAAIRGVDPDRLIIADGLRWGRDPVPELAGLNIAQSTRGYDPMQISHYRASWIAGSDSWPEPRWPVPLALNAYLYGDAKPEYRARLVLKGDFSAARRVSIRVHQVSSFANLLISADGAPVFEKRFEPGAGAGEWQVSEYKSEWNIYQAVYDKTYSADIPTGASELVFELTRGDWLTFSLLAIEPFPGADGGGLNISPGDQDWGVKQAEITVDLQGNLSTASGKAQYDRERLWADRIVPWLSLARQGVGVHVGEWGVFSYTPRAAGLAWMRDCLENWRAAGFGWALWNLRGGFGIIDSQRAGVKYERFQGHDLDREMLELLIQG